MTEALAPPPGLQLPVRRAAGLRPRPARDRASGPAARAAAGIPGTRAADARQRAVRRRKAHRPKPGGPPSTRRQTPGTRHEAADPAPAAQPAPAPQAWQATAPDLRSGSGP
ncbi:hypothetical protein GCM10010515_64330 [Streptomyces fructofermentans]|uniref:Uncharacterized protein n=1 Tax=Streptomyces fructofermentans TaxID=152141 RepID=A0A918U3K6_9ACTN|nr:hypothetical protein GCM10010515_64330 [Streptomyces fructofermentans]